MSSDRFEVLYEGYCDGTLTPAERDEFLALLNDPAQRARFVELSTFEAIVTDELGVARSQDKVSSGKMRAVRAARRARFSQTSGFPAWIVASAAAAALLLMVLFGTSAGPRPVKPPPPAPQKDVEAKAPPERPAPPPPKPAPPVREQREPEELVVPPPAPAPKSEPPKKPLPPKEIPKPTITVAAPPKEPEKEAPVVVALVEAVEGRVFVAGDAAAAGRAVRSGEAVETSSGAAAWIKFPDGTLLILGPDTTVSKVVETQGKHLQVEKGLVTVDVPKQTRPMVVAGPHAEATVLGTEFTLSAGPGFTRLDVREGRVRFSRLTGVSSIIVSEGQWAMAVPGQDLSVKPATSQWKAPPGGLLGWYKAEVLKGGAKASSWLDHSGAGHHAIQNGPVAQPEVVEGGRPALRFDGADDFLELPPAFSEFRGGMSAFVVAKPAPGPTAMRIFDLGAEVACDNIVLGKKDGNLVFWALVKSQSRGRVEAPAAILPEQWSIYSVVAQSTGRAALYRNGTLVGAGSTSQVTGPIRKNNVIGKAAAGGELYRGELAELLIYQRALGDAERQYIDAYLWAKHLDPTLPAPLPKKP